MPKFPIALESIIMFNQRVLSLGEVLGEKEYTMNELKKALSFNQIFINNMNEIFRGQKNYIKCIPGYISDLKIVNKNLRNIVKKIGELDKSIRIDISDYDVFEKRLSVRNLIKNGLISSIVEKHKFNEYIFEEGIIYYIFLVKDMYIISYLDPKARAYQVPVSYKFNGYMKYWKTDMSILSYLKDAYNHEYGDDTINGVAMKVVKSSETHKIVKVDLMGDNDDITEIHNHIKINAGWTDKFIIKNQFMYMNDIDQIISSSDLYQNTTTNTNVFTSDDKKSFSLSDIFDNDMLVEYPTESFDLYLRLLHLASIDKRVESIYVTLYRIGDNPIIYYILRDAVRRGIQVHVNIELRASEERINLFWAKEMRSVGIDVVHYADGFLKVHCKLTLIKFKDGKMISQIGTGNYHSQTTSLYTDLSLITADEKICSQILDLFNVLVHGSEKAKFNNTLLVTRYNARDVLKELILDQAKLGDNGLIQIKCNSLDDAEISGYLDIAASNGCQINLIVRGICTWIPPEETLNKNVIIKSIVWDKLEHSRVYCFGKVNPTIYIGSLDLITNKLDNRIETLVKITDRNTLIALCDYLSRYNTINSCWYMTLEDGRISYKRMKC